MTETFIADMRQFTDPEPGEELTAPAVRIRKFLGQIIGNGTTATPGRLTSTKTRCRRRPGHKACSGRIDVMLTEVPAQIRWVCPECGDNGIVTHWQGTPWDLTPRSRSEPEPPRVDIVLTGMEHRAIQKIDILDQPTREVVDAARETADGMVIRCTDEQLDDLVGFLSAEVNHEKRTSRREMLRAILRRVQPDDKPLELR